MPVTEARNARSTVALTERRTHPEVTGARATPTLCSRPACGCLIGLHARRSY